MTSLGLNTGDFPSRDMQIRSSTPPSKAESLATFRLGSITTPEYQVFSFLLLGHTFKKEGAGRITGILPYVACSREDKPKAGQSLAADWMGSLLKASRSDEIWTIDLQERTRQTTVPLTPEIPFSGGDISRILGEGGIDQRKLCVPLIRVPFRLPGNAGRRKGNVWTNSLLRKHRTAAGIVHRTPVGKAERCAVIVHAILDTGATVVSACEKLVSAGAGELYSA